MTRLLTRLCPGACRPLHQVPAVTPPDSAASPQDRRTVVPLLSLCAFASAASMRICDPLLPVLATQFDVPLASAAATTNGFALAYGLCQFFLGPLGDRYGKLLIVVVTGALAGLAAIACALAPDLQSLIVARLAAGAFAGASIPLSMAWIGDNVPFAERQPVLARYLIGQMLGMSSGLIVGGVLADWIGWRAAFWLIAVAFGIAAFKLWPRARLEARRQATPDQDSGLVRQFLDQSRVLLLDPWSRRIILFAGIEGFLLFGAMALVPSFVQVAHQFSPTAAGLSAALFGVGGIVYASNARRMLTQLGPAGLALIGGALFAVAMAINWLTEPTLWMTAPDSPRPDSDLLRTLDYLVFAAPLVAGLGYYMLHNTLQVQASQMNSAAARGIAFSWFASSLWVGQGLGVTAAALLAGGAGFVPVFIIAGVGVFVLALRFAAALRARQ